MVDKNANKEIILGGNAAVQSAVVNGEPCSSAGYSGYSGHSAGYDAELNSGYASATNHANVPDSSVKSSKTTDKKGFFSNFFSLGSSSGDNSGNNAGSGSSGGMKSKGDGILRKLKNIKHIEIIIAVGAVLLMLMIYFVGLGGGSKKTAEPEVYSGSDYCAKMQSELSAYVSKIKGAGNTQVIINWESSVELLLAGTESDSPNSSTKTPTIINSSGSSKPIVIKEIYPKAIGVVVVCQGGSDARVKVDIMMSVSTLLQLSTDKIIVLPMTK